MPDFGTPVAGRNTVDPNQGMQQLSGMMNLQRGMQAYQQSNEMFPQQLKEATANANVADQTQQPRIDSSVASAENARSTADSNALNLQSQKATLIGKGYVGLINDPLIISAQNNPDSVDRNKLTDYVKNWGMDQAKSVGIPQDQALKLFQPYLDKAQTDPAGLRDYVIKRHITGLDQAGQLASYQQTSTAQPGGLTTTNTPGIGKNTVSVAPTNGIDTARPGETPRSADISSPVPLPHMPRNANQPYIPDQNEDKDSAAGASQRLALNDSLNNSATTNTNIQEAYQAITGIKNGFGFSSGLQGDATRAIANAVGSTRYKQLNKDLANLQISQLKAQGGDMGTDAGKHLMAAANGDETYPPDVLQNILQRTQATQTELQMKAPGMQAFSQRYGDANSAKFTQEWAKNANDQKVFQAIAIGKSDSSATDKQKQIDDLLGSDPKARSTFFTRYNNLKSLSATGGLPASSKGQ